MVSMIDVGRPRIADYIDNLSSISEIYPMAVTAPRVEPVKSFRCSLCSNIDTYNNRRELFRHKMAVHGNGRELALNPWTVDGVPLPWESTLDGAPAEVVLPKECKRFRNIRNE